MSDTHEMIHGFLKKTTININKTIRMQEIIESRNQLNLELIASLPLVCNDFTFEFLPNSKDLYSLCENRKRNPSSSFVRLDMLKHKVDNKF